MTHIMQEIVDATQGDFSRHSLSDAIENQMQLVSKHVEDGHGAENLWSTEFLLHNNSLSTECELVHKITSKQDPHYDTVSDSLIK